MRAKETRPKFLDSRKGFDTFIGGLWSIDLSPGQTKPSRLLLYQTTRSRVLSGIA